MTQKHCEHNSVQMCEVCNPIGKCEFCCRLYGNESHGCESEARVFYVVDSIEDNEELFETLEQAENYQNTLKKEDKPRLYIAMVRNAFYEEDLRGWNYDDLADTFNIIKIISE